MKKIVNLITSVIAISVILLSGVASAHVIVQPARVGVAEFQIFTVNVPTEKDVPTTAVRLLMPAGLDEVIPTLKPGWDISTKKNGDKVTEIDWSNGSLPPGFRDDFTFSAEAPAQPTELHWKAYQTYADGSVVAWDATPNGNDDASGNKGPYSTTRVVNDLNTPVQTKTSNSSEALAIIAIALAALAFVKSWVRR